MQRGVFNTGRAKQPRVHPAHLRWCWRVFGSRSAVPRRFRQSLQPTDLDKRLVRTIETPKAQLNCVNEVALGQRHAAVIGEELPIGARSRKCPVLGRLQPQRCMSHEVRPHYHARVARQQPRAGCAKQTVVCPVLTIAATRPSVSIGTQPVGFERRTWIRYFRLTCAVPRGLYWTLGHPPVLIRRLRSRLSMQEADAAVHLSFVLSAFSFVMRNLLMLRSIALMSAAVGIYYNYEIPAGPCRW